MNATSKFSSGTTISRTATFLSVIFISTLILFSVAGSARTYAADLNQDFDNVATMGWTFANRSTLIGLTDWHQGMSGIFTAHEGPSNAYVAADAGSAVAVGTISNWLITPVISTLSNGDSISFYTRTVTTVVRPDRLQVRVSTNGACSPGLTETTTGDFTTLLLDINPNLTTSGYPSTWTQYTATLSGLSGTVSGCFAFRHFVTSAGLLGTNGGYIGLDTFAYTDLGAPTATPTNTPIPPRPDTIGAYKDGTFYLRNSNTTGTADITAMYGGDPSDLPVTGDWNGDGVDTIGVYRSSTGFYFLSDSNTTPAVNYNFIFGNPGDTPFAGRWTADMTGDGVGVYRNSNGILYQRKSLTSGFDDYFAIYGNPGDKGFAGDWDANGFDSIGTYRASLTTWYLSNNSEPVGVTFSDIDFVWDIGDWDGDGDSTPGHLSASGLVTLRQSNSGTSTDMMFPFGPAGSKPVAGKWTLGSRPARVSVVIGVNAGNPSSGAANPDSAD
jgi:hypothetical protein